MFSCYCKYRLAMLGGLIAAVFAFAFPQPGHAQRGYSTASLAMVKERASRGAVPVPQAVVVEEFVNYHTHNIPMPAPGDHLGLDVRWGNPQLSPQQEEGILQVGLSSLGVQDFSTITPLNVCLVIDKSGSMSGPRMQHTKEALAAFVKRLRPQDRVSIVSFDQAAQVVLPPSTGQQAQALSQAIQQIVPGGSTNMDDGILTGYQQLMQHYDPSMTNRMVILTDAMTNTGVVDPQQIIQRSSQYHQETQVDFTFIGVGVDFNHELARLLTANSRNSIHFINDPEDIEKVFVNEVEALLAPVARDVELTITLGAGLALGQVYGYAPTVQGNTLTIPLNNINRGLTQVVLAKVGLVPPNKGRGNSKNYAVQAQLSYYDIAQQKKVTLTMDAPAQWAPNGQPAITDPEVKKNYAIASMAEGLRALASHHANGNTQQAEKVAMDAVQRVDALYNGRMDGDIYRVYQMLMPYVPQTFAAAGRRP